MIVVEFPMLPPWIAYTNDPKPALPKPLPVAGPNISLPVNFDTVCPGTYRVFRAFWWSSPVHLEYISTTMRKFLIAYINLQNQMKK